MTTYQGRLPMIVPLAFDSAEWAGDELGRVKDTGPKCAGNRKTRRAAEARARKQSGDNG